MKIVIIGGGASGLLLANLLKDYDVLVLEKEEHAGKKLLVTGNGKANITNTNINPINYNNEKAFSIAKSFDVRKYFENLGLLTYVDNEGRVYPLSNTANSVVDTLRDVNIKTNYNVQSIKKENDKYIINDDIEADYVILATGGKTYYKDSNSYILASKLGMQVSTTRPSLCQIRVDENLASLNNLKAKVKATLLVNNKEVYETYGEVLFKESALSGICMFELSSIMNRYPSSMYKIKLDMLPTLDDLEFDSYKAEFHSLNKLFNKMIAMYIEKHGSGKYLYFHANESIDFKNAQVTSGGVLFSNLNSKLESKANPNLYVIGELLDGDGTCGGYNLTFAFGSAYIVANDIKQKLNYEDESSILFK